jgi:hypothetical protein
MSSDYLQAISANWLKSLEVASSTGDTASFVNNFLPHGWFRGQYLSECLSWSKCTHKYSQIFYVFPGNSGHYQDKTISVNFSLRESMGNRDSNMLVFVTSS